MAYIHYSFHTEIELQIELPDSKLLDLLTFKSDLIRYITIDWIAIEKDLKIKAGSNNGDECIASYPRESDITHHTIEKKNGSEYKWDGKKLTKI
jgi:hypothetical protein